MQSLLVYTDGACTNNGKKNAMGGIGIHFPNKELPDISQSYKAGLCTNQKTELYAILTALRYINVKLGLKNYQLTIKTDSQYSINCITQWVKKWSTNNWLTKANTPVLNREYIQAIDRYYRKYNISFVHVHAHTRLTDNDSLANAVADKLATDAIKKKHPLYTKPVTDCYEVQLI